MPRPPVNAWRTAGTGLCRLRAAGDRGSVTTELAVFVVPFLILLAVFMVFCGRAASAAIDANAVASAAARAAAAAPSAATARTAATRAARAMASGNKFACTTTTDTGQFRLGGSVSVRVACVMHMDDLGLPRVGATKTAVASATEPIDTYRAGT